MCALVCYKYTVQEIPQLVRYPVGTEVGRWDPLFTFMARVIGQATENGSMVVINKGLRH